MLLPMSCCVSLRATDLTIYYSIYNTGALLVWKDSTISQSSLVLLRINPINTIVSSTNKSNLLYWLLITVTKDLEAHDISKE